MTRIHPVIQVLALILALVTFSVPSYADKLIVDGLTEEQAAELRLKAAQMKASPEPADVASRMSEYAEIGQKYGVALAATAKELGIAADELLDTTVGKVALVLIVWKVMGSELIGLLIGIPWLLIGSAVWLYLFRRMCVIKSIELVPVKEMTLRKKTITYHSEGAVDGTRLMVFICSAIVWLPAIIMIFE